MLSSVNLISANSRTQIAVIEKDNGKFELNLNRSFIEQTDKFEFEIVFDSKIKKIRNHDYEWINFKKGFVATAYAPKIFQLESGFFVQVFKWLADAVVGKIEDDLVENISDSVRDKKEKAQIKQKLNKTFERYFKEQYEYLPLSKEFDINTLNEWLLENLYSIVLNYFIADSSEKRSYYKSSLMESSYARARADTKEKKKSWP